MVTAAAVGGMVVAAAAAAAAARAVRMDATVRASGGGSANFVALKEDPGVKWVLISRAPKKRAAEAAQSYRTLPAEACESRVIVARRRVSDVEREFQSSL